MAVEMPEWFRRAAKVRSERGHTTVDGVDVGWLAWGERDLPPMVLVHGGAAHAEWWRAIGPYLTDHRVIAIDLSGHGHSGRRERYSADTWAAEVLAVARDAGSTEAPVIVGHSMGGFVTVVTAARYGSELRGAIVLDAPIRRADPESELASRGRFFRAPKIYPDLATAKQHFHLVPPQPSENLWLLDHIAEHSLHEVEEGWTWRFDPSIFTRRLEPDRRGIYADALSRAACPIAVVFGELSDIVDDEVRTYMAEVLTTAPAAQAGVPFVEVPEAHHHLLIDQPLAVVTAIRTILAGWEPLGKSPAEVTVV